jgi:serine/threonine protein kinase
MTHHRLAEQSRPEAGTVSSMVGSEVGGGVAFGRYRLLDRIATGDMAEVFRGVAVGAQGFERVVAIKRIRPEVAQAADVGKLFADEARLSAMLEHPNIVQVYDFGAVEETFYIAMEYMRGRNLEQTLGALRATRQRMPPAMAVLIAREVARGLGYAHAFRDERGNHLAIVHRDVHPSNIMLLDAGAVKLVDFGIARVTSELRLATTGARAGSLRGECPFLSPEQITGEPVDARSDLFALGTVLWEMLTGRRLFEGGSDFDIMSAVINGEIAPPSRMVPELPEALDRVVLTALDRDPQRRYQSGDQLAADLEQLMGLLPSRHTDLPALLGRLGRTDALPALDELGTPTPHLTVPRRRGGALALVTVTMLGLAALAAATLSPAPAALEITPPTMRLLPSTGPVVEPLPAENTAQRRANAQAFDDAQARPRREAPPTPRRAKRSTQRGRSSSRPSRELHVDPFARAPSRSGPG